MCGILRLLLGEELHKSLCAIEERITRDRSETERAALTMLIEQAVTQLEPLLAAVDDAATVRDKRAAALRAALDDVRWKPENLKMALGHRSGSSVSRYLSGEESIPERVYALPEVGPAFHRRQGQMLGVRDEKKSG